MWIEKRREGEKEGGKERWRREEERENREGGGKECLHIPPVLYQTSYRA